MLTLASRGTKLIRLGAADWSRAIFALAPGCFRGQSRNSGAVPVIEPRSLCCRDVRQVSSSDVSLGTARVCDHTLSDLSILDRVQGTNRTTGRIDLLLPLVEKNAGRVSSCGATLFRSVFLHPTHPSPASGTSDVSIVTLDAHSCGLARRRSPVGSGSPAAPPVLGGL